MALSGRPFDVPPQLQEFADKMKKIRNKKVKVTEDPKTKGKVPETKFKRKRKTK